jgi:hypothetical protein
MVNGRRARVERVRWEPVERADRQVSVQFEQFPEVARSDRQPNPLLEFVQGQPALDERLFEDPDRTVPVGH